MRLHRVRLQDFRAVADREVVFAVDGVTIVEGPNEAGKTSLAEAVDLVLSLPDSSNARQIRDIAPVHHDAGPRVEVEISTGPYRFRYAKQWVKQRTTTLDILEPRREQLTGRQAHERVEAMLAETIDGDLWAALRLQQGAELAQAAFDTPALARALDAAAGGEPSDPGDDDLVARIAAERDRYWTAKGAPRADRVERRAAVEAAAEEVRELRDLLSDLDAQAERVVSLTLRLDDLGGQRAACAEELATATAASAAAEAAQRELDQLVRAHETARARLGSAHHDLARRQELVDDVANMRSELEKLRAEKELAAPPLGEARTRAVDAAAAVAEVESRLVEGRQCAERARRHLEHLHRRAELERWRARHERVATAEAARSAARRVLERVRIDQESLATIERAAREVVETSARLEVAGARVVAEGSAPVRMRVQGVDEALAAGQRREWVAAEPWTVSIDDRVTLTVEPGEGARDLARRAAEAHDVLREACEEVGVTTVEEAREEFADRVRAERDEAAARADLERDLDGLTPTLLAERVEALAAGLAGTEAQIGGDAPASLAEAEAAVARSGTLVAELEAEHGERTADERLHRSQLDNARVEERILDGRIEQVELSAEKLECRLSAARRSQPDDDLRASVEAATAEAEVAAEQLARAEEELAALDPTSVALGLTNARAALTRVDEAIRTTTEERQRLVATLEVQGERGLATDLDTAQSRLEHLQREHERIEARAEAARLLHDTVDARRRAARLRYLEPFRAQIERLGRIVFGADLEIELAEDLRIARRVLGGVALDFDQLSVGAREQLGILARLACASIVSADGGAPVIFDDVLGYTDPDRLRTMGTAIAAASAGCQVIVLTSTPGRYAQVGNAQVVSLG